MRMSGLWNSLGTGARLGIPAAAICAIVVSRIPTKAYRISHRTHEGERDLEPYMYSECPFPAGRRVNALMGSRHGSS